jgi:thiosulfate reductase / polysulfide reductase chain A
MAATAVETRVLKSVCHGCHGGCSVLLHVDGDRLTKIEGDPDGPLNHGAVCPIGVGALDLVYHPDRLKYPMKRKGPRGAGTWERISWDEAFDTIVAKINQVREEYGPESIVMGTGTGRHHCKWVIRFANALGTPNWCEPGTAQCFIPRVNVGFLTYGSFPVGDFSGAVRPKTICYWGHNPLNSGPDGETRFAARENLVHGKPKVLVIDPRETELTKRADVWLRLRPGTDDALALAMIHVLIEEELYDREFVAKWCHGFAELAAHVKQYSPEWAEPITWVPAATIRAGARLLALQKPMQMEWGCAIEHTPNTIQTVRAVALLPALTGNIDIPGGWVFAGEELGMFAFLEDKIPPEVAKKRLGYEQFKILTQSSFIPAAHIPAVLKAIKDSDPYPVKAFLVFGNNTLTTYANSNDVREALEKIEFMIHADLFMTPTAEYADIVLPVAAWPELDEVHDAPFVSAYVIGPIQKAVQVGECKSDEDILVELARRLKLPYGTESPEEVYNQQLAQCKTPLTFAELKQRGSFTVPIHYRKHETQGFKTPTGKVELYSTQLEAMGYAPLPYYEEPPESPYSTPEVAKDYPLVLTTGHRSPFFFHSEGRQIHRQRKGHKEPRAEIHPDTAARYGIREGEWMSIENQRGKIRQRARFSAAIDPRVIAVEHGWWFPEQEGPEYGIWQSNANVLTNNQPPYDPAMGTYQLRGLLCRVGPISAA